MLFTQKSEVDIHEMSPLALAFVGDAVLELLVRARLVGTTRLQPNRLHTVATHYVSAHAQNLELAVIEPMLTDAEAFERLRGEYKIGYVYFGSAERMLDGNIYGYLAENYPAVFDSCTVTIFDLR